MANKEVVKQWVEALRSGRYIQGKAYLSRNNQFCCLGVLCDLYIKQHEGAAWIETGHPAYLSAIELGSENHLILPKEVIEWCELDSRNPLINHWCLSVLNDHHEKTFSEIADMIEKQYLTVPEPSGN